MPARLYVYDTIFERLPQHLQGMAAELREFVQKQHAIVGQRYLAWHRHVTATDQAHLGDGMMRGATRVRGDDGGAGAGEAGDAVDAGGFNGFGEGHRRQDGGEPPRQPRLPHPRRAQEENIMVTTPA
jgi:hypothetical protein